ncbi:cupin domain-containing protein [Kiloniella laminariae]|uniref:cupin domain-containing protein n=1 Tax=Kiloniella laminariae TaxID=454162 RepID=UPI0003756451|nr:cupin domain-containing protein [Kiloniella laminariae]
MVSAIDEEFLRALLNDRIGTELVLDTAEMRVWHLRLQPGERLPAHRHDRPYFWTVLTDGTGHSRFGDGSEVEIVYRAGDTRYYDDLSPENGFVHDLENTGKYPLVFVTVEYNR